MSKKKRKKKNRLKRKLFSFIILIITGIIVFSGLFVFAVYHNIFGHIPDESEISAIHHETATLVYSNDQQLIGKYFAQNRTNIQWEQLPDHLVHALISTEDARYFEHEGIDSRSLMRVLIKSVLLGDKSAGGGSTITQQLAKNLYGRKNYGILTLPVIKVKENIIAYRLEKIYNKKEILQLYLNTVPFGEDTYGIEAAANRFFNKKTSQLTIQESAVLVGLLKANTYYNPRLNPENARRRRNIVLHQMAKYDFLDEEEANQLKKTSLKLDYSNYNRQGQAAYFLKHVRDKAEDILENYKLKSGKNYDLEKDGLTITTTLDYTLQRYAREAIRQHLSKMQEKLDAQFKGRKNQFIAESENSSVEKREIFTWDGIKAEEMSYSDSLWHYKKMLEAGLIIQNPKNGNILCWIGGNHYRYLPFDLVRTKRQAASVFKPVLYATALEQGYEPCDYLANKQPDLKEYKDWKPENYDHSTGGAVAMWYALANSMNLPAIDLYRRVGHKDFDYITTRLGFEETLPDKPSAALGTIDVSLLELASAYSAFANKGYRPGSVMIKEIQDNSGKTIYKKENTQSEKALSEKTAKTMTAMLLKATSEGTGQAMYTTYGINSKFAGKTGTSQDYKDARYVCYNNNLVIATWVGTRSRDIHFRQGIYGSGSRLALPIAAKILNNAQHNPNKKSLFKAPAIPEDTSGMFDCKPQREKSAGRDFLQKMVDLITDDKKNLTKQDSLKNEQEKSDTTKEQESTKVGRIIRKILGKNDS
ncbi:MAG: transglycosylase domain-containing protein [Bacteroidales bacterium]